MSRPRDPEIRRLHRGVAALGIVAAGVGVAATVLGWSLFYRSILERDAGLAGRLLARYPDEAPAIMEALTRAPDAEAVAVGRAAAGQFGYDEALPARLVPFLRFPLLASIAVVPLLLLATAASVGLHARLAMRSLFDKTRGIAAAAETIAEGNPRLRLEESDEGELSVLSHRINQMAERLLAAMEQLQREKEFLKGFLTDVSHQLKTPLSSVRMFTDLVHEGVPERERRDFLERSQGQLDRMEWLIASLLTVARLEAGAVEFDVVDASLGETIGSALAGLQAPAGRAGVRIVWTPPESRASIPHDRRWLREALSNVVKNSIEHTPPEGSVTIELETTAVFARITVTDTGEGIAREDLPRIFDRFYQARGGPATGTGIGLALARAIADRHHGTLSAENSPGGGARFTLTLPARDI